MPLPPMVSYAQNAEDVVLRRVFADRTEGFYVDVGACVPVLDSVTLHFYEKGWHGVNVEPDPRYHAELEEARARDINLCTAIGRNHGHVSFYPTPVRGQGTLDPDLAAERSATEAVSVAQTTLDEVFAAHAPETGIDFLKVDVEGWETEVLGSTDWATARPRIVVVEAVDAAGNPTHEDWEPSLIAAGYHFGLFDGLNRFYCREEDATELLGLVAAPANVLDNWRPAREVEVQLSLESEIDDREKHIQGLREVLDVREREIADVTSALDAERELHAETRGALTAEETAHDTTRRLLAAEREDHARVVEQLAGVLASTSWRITAPLRDASRVAKLVRRGSAR